jgi:hypothetical protein
MPISEFRQHKWFWDNYRWGMQDDLLSIQIASDMTGKGSRNLKPHHVKLWTTQNQFTYQLVKLVIKPTAVIRSGFMAIANAISGMNKK